MKRLLAGMLCAVLLALFSMPAVGETEVAHGIFELYDESGESASWLGVAAPVLQFNRPVGNVGRQSSRRHGEPVRDGRPVQMGCAGSLCRGNFSCCFFDV